MSTLQDDTQSDTPTLPGSKHGGKNKKNKPRLKFKCTNWVKVSIKANFLTISTKAKYL